MASTTGQGQQAKICMMCFEPGALRRACCKALYCDHCYVKNQKCPNCKALTNQEKLTGATFQVKVFSEHEECRVCLDPGLRRKCCGNFYCDKCFFSVAQCRSCSTPVGDFKDTTKINWFTHLDKAFIVSVALGWLVTVFVAMVSLAFIAVVATAEATTNTGLSDYKCYGFFRQCNVDDMNDDVARGTAPIPALSNWSYCTLSSSTKLQSKACIYDMNLYRQSNKLLGYDVCQSEFNEGMYIFEDTFEHWRNTSYRSNNMLSARWQNIYNGFTNDYCGAARGSKSLYFGGDDFRFAETIDLDLSVTGGYLEAEIFMPPIGFDARNPKCKTGYLGTINVEYSVNRGRNWTIFAQYAPELYRQNKFFSIRLAVPQEAVTNTTRFRFHQPVFDLAADNWALDNVKVLRLLPNDWHYNRRFERNVITAQKKIQQAQCCLDTDWCEKRYSADELQQCATAFPAWYNSSNYLFRLSEIFLCVAVFVNLLRFVYLAVHDYQLHRRVPFHDELVQLMELPAVEMLRRKIPMKYRPRKLVVDKESAHIHKAARLEAEMRQQFQENEGEGAMLRQRDVIERERKAFEKRVKRQKKKLLQRQGKKNFKMSTIVVEVKSSEEEKLESHVILEEADKKSWLEIAVQQESSLASSSAATAPDIENNIDGQEVALPSDLEKTRRQNLAMMRVPFEVEEDPLLRHIFAVCALTVFVVLFLYELGSTPSYSIYQPITSLGISTHNLYVNSHLMSLFAGYCDFKEIYHVLRHVIPLRKTFIPQVTLDLAEEKNILYIGEHRVALNNIREIIASPIIHAYLYLLGIALGVFPWCVLSQLLRQVVLTYATMRFVTPFLGTVFLLRAVLGPLFVIKIVFACQFLFSMHYRVRELIGAAVQKPSSLHAALNVGVALCFFGSFLALLTAVDLTLIVFVACLVGGFVVGLFTGAAHELPIKPWLYLTTLRAGYRMHLRRARRCPCNYWGRYCTDVHNYEEVFIIFTTDEIKFAGVINNGIIALQGG